MINLKRFIAVVKARNIEFFRDKSSLGWNLFFPVIMLVGLSFVFSGDGRPEYKVGLLTSNVTENESTAQDFLKIRYIEFIEYAELAQAEVKLKQHQIDLLIDFEQQTYWVNEGSRKSYLIEQMFLAQNLAFERIESYGKPIRYVDWVLPGLLGMNMMFSCLFGVGYVIVRYRKNSVLKRLKATPLTALEFVSAQLISRLLIVMFMSSVVYAGCNFFFDFYMEGSYLDLFIIGALGAFSLISLGLLIASRSKSDELVGGLLNLTSWPMMLLSSVWFSIEGAPKFVQVIAELLPLTHLVEGARKIITQGATLGDISYHVSALLMMSAIFLFVGSTLFSWNAER